MAVKTPETKDEQDRAYSPETLRASEGYVSSGVDQAEAFANDPNNSTAGISNTKQQEESTPEFKNNVTGNSNANQSRLGKLKGIAKKGGPLGIIGVIAGFGLFGIGLLSPGLAIVQIKEMFTEDLNDQLAAMDIRTTQVMKAKLNDMGSGALCTRVTPAKCKFKGMSDRQIKKFKAAGIEVDVGDNPKNNVTRKTKVQKLTFSDGTEVKNPAEARRLLTSNLTVRKELRKAFNPKFAGFYDNLSAKVFSRYNTSKASKVTGDTDEDRDRNIEKSAKEGTGGIEDSRAVATSDGEGNQNYNSTSGEPVPVDVGDEANTKANDLSSSISKKAVAGSAFKGATKGVLVTGAFDAACTVKNTARAVMAASKLIKKRQLIGFSMVFLSFADEVKAGTATADQAEYIGNKLTSVDTNEMTVNENSTVVDGKLQETDNPYFGKNAFDSEGYKVAAYNDAPDLTARANQFSIGGAFSGTMANTLSTIGYKNLGDTTCKVIQSPVVRLGSAAIGVVAAIGSFGLTTAASVSASVAVSMALPFLESYLADIISGSVVSKNTKGVDAGNAVFAGTAGIEGDVAMARGMQPANKSNLREYLATSNSIKDEYVAMETQDAKATPFDIYNQYSFLGSITRKIVPVSMSVNSSIAALPNSSLDIVGIASETVFPNTSAAGKWNPDRFSKCDDEAYAKLDIDADIFCNVRYTMSSEELSMDTDTVIDFMTSNPDYLSEDGTPGETYQKWLEECTERTAGWGERPEGQENGGEGKLCLDGKSSLSKKTLQNFRVYTMDNSINEAMEYEGPTSSSGSTSNDGLAAGGNVQGDDYKNECRNYTGFYGAICNGQCVSFVMFRLAKHKVIDTIVFGNGKDVVAALGRRGFATNKKPAVNSVFSTSQTSQPQFGHTGMVSKVNPDGSIVVEEYNFQTPRGYGTRTISKAEYTAKGYTFAHTETKYQ